MLLNNISKVAVIGSGVMGSGIAAHIANSNIPVILYDIATPDKDHPSSLAKQAIQNLLTNPLKPLMSKNLVSLITPANLRDDLDLLKDVDWVIEAVTEKLDIKRELYKKISAHKRYDTIVSSNTSTIPLTSLIEGFDKDFCENFLITHFFNPPRYLTLLELVVGTHTKSEVVHTIQEFCEIKLGKEIVNCKDTPGFIANRIGCYWLEVALRKAIQENIPINIADKILADYFGIPKTGVFGLWDLIGIDLMPLITQSIIQNLDKEDDYTKLCNEEISIIPKMINEGLLGRKAKAGFYKIIKNQDKTVTQYAMNLKTGEYELLDQKSELPKFNSLKELLEYPANYARFAWRTMASTLNYAASLIPQAAFSIYDIDMAMKNGYGWKYGPFELIDLLSEGEQNGGEWLKIKLELANRSTANIFRQIGNKKFYTMNHGKKEFFYSDDTYIPIKTSPNILKLENIKQNNSPLFSNKSANIWDVGDNILCLELTKKMHVLDIEAFNAIEKIVDIASNNNKGIIIGNDDNNFCAGADVNLFLQYIEQKEFDKIEELITHGQKAMLALKHSKAPVVSAICGATLGGGCELVLHSDAVQAFAEVKIGLVETNIGLIPGWGGCKETVLKTFSSTSTKRPTDEIISNFNLIRNAITSDSAISGIELGILPKNTRITMNKNRLLSDAKNYAIELLNTSKANKLTYVHIDTQLIKDNILKALQNENLKAHEKKIANCLSKIFTNNDNSAITEKTLLDLEKECFMELIKSPETMERIESLIKHKKVIIN
ncbi:MAG: enoyl-CoA hydratase/isomerase family protein [Sphingobacteriia bacterium]|nr:enoyl-CoA hydratase/isomerase family protein [Sphingobacteriia bacterium]